MTEDLLAVHINKYKNTKVFNKYNFRRKINVLLETIKSIDINILTKYKNLLEDDYNTFLEKFIDCDNYNFNQINNIINEIETYNINKQYDIKLEEYVNKCNKDYTKLESLDIIYNYLVDNITQDIIVICNNNNKRKKVITTIIQDNIKSTYTTTTFTTIMDINIDEYIDKSESYKNIIFNNIKNYITNTMTKYGFINNTCNIDKFNYIKFIKLQFNTINDCFLMTESFYDWVFNDFLEYFFSTLSIKEFDKTVINKSDNVKFILYEYNNFDNYISDSMKNNFNNVLNEKFLYLLMKYISTNKSSLCDVSTIQLC